jgi:RNA polymerase sigma-70 factor (ECF subfamily)
MSAEHALGAPRAGFAARPGEDELASAAHSGDLNAFEALVRLYQRRVYALAYQHVRDTDEAQDLAQEVFVRLYRNLGRFDPQRPFEPWFWRLAGNVALSYHRRRVAVPAELPDAAAAERRDTLPLEQALADLSPELRLPVLLHYYADRPLEEVAAAMNLTVSAVKSRLHRARAVLRRVLVEDEP